MPTVEVFYSFRSPYCYLLTPRLRELSRNWSVKVEIRPVYPIAIRNPEYFARVDPLYRPYHVRDSVRLAQSLGIPYRRPIPDPVVQDLATGKIADHQPYIRRLTRLGIAAVQAELGLDFISEIMPILWSGNTNDWDKESHLADGMARIGLNPVEMEKKVVDSAGALDAIIESNHVAQRQNGHWGVPLMALDGEPFYGQDRFSLLLWRLEQMGLKDQRRSSN